MIETLIEKLFHRFFKSENYKAVVVSVDKATNTCIVTDTETGTERKVKLAVVEQNKDVQLLIYPLPGSLVICGSLYNNRAQGHVIKVHEVDEIIWRDGSEGGMIKPATFLNELDKTNQAVQALLDLFGNWVVVGGDGGGALKTLAGGSLGGHQAGDFSDVQDEKIKM